MQNRDSLLDDEQKNQFEEIAASDTSAARRRRANILLSYNEGKPTREIAQKVGLSRSRVRYWRREFHSRGIGIFARKRGKPAPGSPNHPEETTSRREESIQDHPPSEMEEQGVTHEPTPRIPGDETHLPNEKMSVTELEMDLEEAFGRLDAASTIEQDASPDQGPSKRVKRDGSGGAVLYSEGVQAKGIPFPSPLKSPGIEPTDTLAEAGRKTLLYHFAEMLAHEEGTRLGEDIEELHDMRVATRRMRAAFDLFGEAYAPKAIRQHLRGLRATGRALGAVRDMDVFIEKAGHYLGSARPEERHGLDILVQAWVEERNIARVAMLLHLDSPAYETFKRKFNAFLHSPGKGVRPVSAEFPVPLLVRDIAPVLIYSRFSAVRSYETVLESASLEQLHALRIEFKKLRYAVEFFREVLGREAKQVISTLKMMQDHLGDLNDAQVACQLLNDFLTRLESSQLDLPLSGRQNPEPVVVYLAAKHAERHQLMRSFPQAWERFNQPEFRQNLALAIAAL